MTTKQQLEEISTKLIEGQAQMTRILFILESSPEIDTKGLVEKVNDNTKGIAKSREFEKKWKTITAVIGSGAGIVGGLLLAFFKSVFFK